MDGFTVFLIMLGAVTLSSAILWAVLYLSAWCAGTEE